MYWTMESETGRLSWFEANSGKLFLAGGALYAVFLANQIFTTYTGTSFQFAETFAWTATILFPLGLLGLYPDLVERRPYLSRAAAVVAVILAISSTIAAIGVGILRPTGILTEAPGLLALTPLVGIGTLYLSFGLFGTTALLADIHPKAVGILMVVTASVSPLFMTVLSELPQFIGNVINVVAYLGIGLILLSEGVPTFGADSPADTPA